MAIIKELNSSYGIQVSYHKITVISINYVKKKVVIGVVSYLDKKIRSENYSPIDTIDVEVPAEDYPLFLSTNVIVVAYQWLKDNVVGFEDATDDLEPLYVEPEPEKEPADVSSENTEEEEDNGPST